MGYYYQWEDFRQKGVSYLKGREDSEGLKIRVMSTENMMFSQVLVKGGAKVPRHYHKAEQVMFIQKGEAIITTDDDGPRELKAGDIWVVPSNVVHGVEYVGDVEALEVVSPPRLDNLEGYIIKHTFFEDRE